MTADGTEPTIIHLPARVREALGGIAIARGVSLDDLIQRVLANTVAAEARWHRYPRDDRPTQHRSDTGHQRRASDRPRGGPTDPEGGQAGAEGGRAPSR